MSWLKDVDDEKSDDKAITLSEADEVLGSAEKAIIAKLLGKIASQDSEFRLDKTNSVGRLIVIRETGGRVNLTDTSNNDKK